MSRAAERPAKSRQRPNLPPVRPAGPSAFAAKAAALALAAVGLVLLFSTEIQDTDFWWHLKTGQYILQHHALPVPDPFAYTTSAAPASAGEAIVRRFNLTHEWLSQVLMYAVYAVGGWTGIVLARALLLAALCGLAGFLAARLSNFYAGLAAACATAWLAMSFTADRPGVVSFLGVAVFVTLLELRRGWWALPLLALLWSNCHGGFVLGWVVLLAYAAETVPLRRGAQWPPEGRRLWLIAACAIAASGVNPNGFRALSTLLAYRSSAMTANLIEWAPPKLWGSPYSFDILLYAAALVLVLSWRKVRRAHWILFAAFAAASLMAFRNTLLIGFLAPVLIAAWFPFRFRLRIPQAAAWAVALLTAAGIVVEVSNGWPQFRVAAWTVPSGAADYLLAHHLTGPIFNTYEQGGYLIWRLWPEARVFIDGRALSDSLYRDYNRILFNGGGAGDQVVGPRAALLDRYGIQVVVMNTMDYVSGAMYPLALALANPLTKDWDLVYDDTQAVIFVRRPSPGTAALRNPLGHVLHHLDAECEAYIANSPGNPLCARTLADYWMGNQVWDGARNMLLLYLSHTKNRDPEAERALRKLP